MPKFHDKKYEPFAPAYIEPVKEVVRLLRSMKDIVYEMWQHYEKNEELNDIISIQKIIPMSLDDWWNSIDAKIESLVEEIKAARR